jgi:serine phosphatase RsbU (regulator of sigma subunit)
MVACYTLVFAEIATILGHNVTICLLFPVILSVRYYSSPLTTCTAGLTVLLSGFSEYYGVARAFGRLNLNLVSLPAGTVLTFAEDSLLRNVIPTEAIDYRLLWRTTLTQEFLPKIILFLMVAFICTEIAKRGRQAILDQKAETAKTERLATELNLASDIQANMLPNLFPAFPEREEFDIYASMVPAKEVGGDFYDFYMIDDRHLAMLIADVSDKGIPAAMFMMASKIIINNVSKLGHDDPGRILEISNQQIVSNNPAEMFVTVWLGILDIETGLIRASNAGHECPCVMHKGEGFTLLKDRHGMVLGGLEFSKYKTYEIQLNAGDAIFVYTDGVAEATNAKEEFYGTGRLLDALNVNPDATAKELLENVKVSMAAFVQDAAQFDDTTMLSLRYHGHAEKA